MAVKIFMHSPEKLPAPLASERKILEQANSSTSLPPQKLNGPPLTKHRLTQLMVYLSTIYPIIHKSSL